MKDFAKDLEPLIQHIENCLLASEIDDECKCRNEALKVLQSAYRDGLLRGAEIAEDYCMPEECKWMYAINPEARLKGKQPYLSSDFAGGLDIASDFIAEAIKKEAGE